ncbi:MAG: hypothetical protein Q8L45_14725 [Xanthomonadaceae bacterium]|nr:hypothetical protein [Xanthomonadaceae bacterium]MDZ4116466.1 hypothetical protein [Xanthomonadaceae bacterium]MDZ4377089.1 hypothetical protein [Xanthomonadaceae bacterium]
MKFIIFIPDHFFLLCAAARSAFNRFHALPLRDSHHSYAIFEVRAAACVPVFARSEAGLKPD